MAYWATSIVCIGAGGFLAQNLYMRLTTGMFKSATRMDGKTVLVTGANTGNPPFRVEVCTHLISNSIE